MWEDDRGWTFHWRKNLYVLWTGILARSNGLKLKYLNFGFVSYKYASFHFIRHYLMNWSGVDYLWIIVMFLSAVGTHSLQRIHWWASDVMLKFNLKKQTHLQYILDGLRESRFSASFFHFWVNYSFKNNQLIYHLLWIRAVCNQTVQESRKMRFYLLSFVLFLSS